MTALAHQHIVSRLNRRRALAPLWEMALYFLCAMAFCGLLASVSICAADISTPHEALPDYRADSAILVALLNGTHFQADGRELSCRWRRKRGSP